MCSETTCACDAKGAPQAAPAGVSLTIDGMPVTVPAGATLLDAAAACGVRIPTLCFLRGVSAVGSCRVCVVGLEGVGELVLVCNTQACVGMALRTATSRVLVARREALELILERHGLDSTAYCFSCAKNGACELQDLCRELGVTGPTHREPHELKPILEDNPFLAFNPNLCIGCQRCVCACAKAGNHTMRAAKAGVRTVIRAPFGPGWRESGCESCGNCAQACPTGAIVEKRRRDYRSWEVRTVRTTCPHCAVGCQLDLVVKGDKIVDAYAADGPSNHGMLCVKGRSASFDFVSAPDRLTTPLLRNKATGELEPASWDDALDAVAQGFGRILSESGGEALAAFACSRSTNEDIYLYQKMARVALHTNNVDNCARV